MADPTPFIERGIETATKAATHDHADDRLESRKALIKGKLEQYIVRAEELSKAGYSEPASAKPTPLADGGGGANSTCDDGRGGNAAEAPAPSKRAADVGRARAQFEREMSTVVGRKQVAEFLETLIRKATVMIARHSSGDGGGSASGSGRGGVASSNDMSLHCPHMRFEGDAGTGKSLIADKLAPVLYELGAISKPETKHVTRRDLVAEFCGQSAGKVAKCFEAAAGGVLVIENAHEICGGEKDQFGNEAVDSIPPLIDAFERDARGLVVILTGPSKQIRDMLGERPALESRFMTSVEFPSYSHQELGGIFENIVVSHNMTLEPSLQSNLVQLITQAIPRSVARRSNAHAVVQLFKQVESSQVNRLYGEMEMQQLAHGASQAMRTPSGGSIGGGGGGGGDDSCGAAVDGQGNNVFVARPPDANGGCAGGGTKAGISVITAADFAGALPAHNEMEAVMQRLDRVVGVQGVKTFVKGLRANIMINEQKRAAGMAVEGGTSLHMIFQGNPGTGKTTIARLVAEMLKTLGVLSKGQLIEATRADFVGEAQGQSAPKTLKLVERAIGGVLFVDEAYALVHSNSDSFGREALDALMKAMEDWREEIVVILAGYTNEMGELVSRNPGIKSRVSHVIEFNDYTGEELFTIGGQMLATHQLLLSPAASEKFRALCDACANADDVQAGNARYVRNVIEDARTRQAMRLCDVAGTRTKEELMTLEPGDFEA